MDHHAGRGVVYTLFLIVFVKRPGVLPFLPGDSLLFAAGVFLPMAAGFIWAPRCWCSTSGHLGLTSNYWIARFFGKRIIDSAR